MEEVGSIYSSLGVASRLSRVKPYPEEQYTTAAVEAFLNNTGSLLYLWSQDEAEGLVKSVYTTDSGLSPGEAVQVFAMSAIGSYCDDDATSAHQQTFMDTFIYLLKSRRDISDIEGMRLLACMAI
jgi:hypothetical protein